MQESVHKNVVNKLLLELQECLNNSDTMECAKSVIKRYIKTYHPDKSGKQYDETLTLLITLLRLTKIQQIDKILVQKGEELLYIKQTKQQIHITNDGATFYFFFPPIKFRLLVSPFYGVIEDAKVTSAGTRKIYSGNNVIYLSRNVFAIEKKGGKTGEV